MTEVQSHCRLLTHPFPLICSLVQQEMHTALCHWSTNTRGRGRIPWLAAWLPGLDASTMSQTSDYPWNSSWTWGKWVTRLENCRSQAYQHPHHHSHTLALTPSHTETCETQTQMRVHTFYVHWCSSSMKNDGVPLDDWWWHLAPGTTSYISIILTFIYSIS